MFYPFRRTFSVCYDAGMVVPFPSQPAPIDVSQDHIQHIARTEAYLDQLLAGLYAQLPADPARYPIRVGDHVIHYRHRPRSVVTAAPERRAG
jgi:hypothetical protein